MLPDCTTDPDFLDELSPRDLNLPYDEWRTVQREAIAQAIYGERRFQALALPTGTGKSLAVIATSVLTGYRTVILTSTKGLQDQYQREFKNADIRGKANYRCNEFRDLTCDEGMKLDCKLAGMTTCAYSNALNIARNKSIVATNYKFWLNINRQSTAGLNRTIGPTNPVQLLVLDEAHLAVEELAGFLAIHITERELIDLVEEKPPAKHYDMAEWAFYADRHHRSVEVLYQDAKRLMQAKQSKGKPVTRQELDLLKRLESLEDRLSRLSGINPADWVLEEHTGTPVGKVWEFDPVWPGQYAESHLFRGIPRVILMSATLRPKTLQHLGIDADEYDFREWKRVFPLNRSPVYHVPSVRLRHTTTEEEMARWIYVIDSIIESRQDRKGIIHTVSYARQKYLLDHSRFSHLMIGNTSDPESPKAAEIVHTFKRSKPPSILVSPSFGTGWDFPGEECEWQIIGKIPFPDGRSKVMQERSRRDKQYPMYLAMQALVQSIGRGMRMPNDRCESFIVDDSIGWFMGMNRSLAPQWFEIRRVSTIPPAPVSLAQDPKYTAA